MDLPYRIKDTESDTDIRDQDALHRSLVYLKCDKNNYTEEDTPYGIYHAMHCDTQCTICANTYFLLKIMLLRIAAADFCAAHIILTDCP